MDPHTVLGVPAGAAAAVVRRAYRRQVRRTHPDAGGSAADFRRVQRAWEALREAESSPDTTSGAPPAAPDRKRAAGPVWAGPPSAAGEWSTVSVVPGRWAWLGRVFYGAVALLVTVAGLWLARPVPDPDGWLGLAFPAPGRVWTAAWVITVVVVGFSLVRGAVSGGLVVLVVLLGFAVGEIGNPWWWGLAGCTVASLVLPVIHLLQFRPMWSTREALDDGPVFGIPDWQHHDSAALVEQLTVIPAVRVFHQVHGVAHIVVCGGQVAAVGAPPGWKFPGLPTVRVWPLSMVEEPTRALDEMAMWLVSAGATTVDRRVLADLAG